MIINKGHIVAEDTPEQLQARLTGSQRVLLKVRGESQDVVPLIQQLPGILQVIEKEDGTLEYESLPGQDARPLVARKIVEAGFDLLQLQPINMSLEEIFLQLTRDETEPSAAMPEVGYSMEEN
uniref:DUF4162 domain-containing protein n=1 Tax=Anaerolinea thermolimosa TaxID=229919 RepID=A0A7C4KHS2_9CHLR